MPCGGRCFTCNLGGFFVQCAHDRVDATAAARARPSLHFFALGLRLRWTRGGTEASLLLSEEDDAEAEFAGPTAAVAWWLSEWGGGAKNGGGAGVSSGVPGDLEHVCRVWAGAVGVYGPGGLLSMELSWSARAEVSGRAYSHACVKRAEESSCSSCSSSRRPSRTRFQASSAHASESRCGETGGGAWWTKFRA